MGGRLFADACARAPDIDAVFCNNDDLALGVLFECNRAAIAVPRQMGICGFNDLDLMGAAFPTLTSVRTPRYEVGRRAVQMILERLAGIEPLPPSVDLGFELQVRDSTRR